MAKYIVVGDLHFGERGDSQKLSGQLIELLDWVCEFKDVDGVIQLGDWFHHRTKLKLDTLNYGIDGAILLMERFGKENVHVLIGNHDAHYHDTLEITSLSAIRPYVNVIDSPTPLNGNCLLVPWITDGQMWDEVVSMSDDFDHCFGHFELNSFKVNEAYTMEHGYSPKGLKKFKTVLSGHYHSYQKKDNIVYLGTPIPITQNESNESHGVFVFDTETGDLEFHEYDKVKVVSIPYTEIESLDGLDPENTSIRIEFPDDLEDETLISDVQEWLSEHHFTDTKIKYRGSKVKELLDGVDEDDITEVENIDEVVLKYITSATTVNGIDNQRLEKYYRLAIQRSVE